MKNTGMNVKGKKDVPNLPASSRLQAPSGSAGSMKKPVKAMVKGSTKTKMK
jgi:hypothetical protein